MRTEVYAADDDPVTAVPYTVKEHRYLVRVLHPRGTYQPYAVLQPMVVESIDYQYEPLFKDDPLCQHSLNLEWDEYGNVIHGVVVHYARRKTADDPPPFSDDFQKTWWRDAHDPAQQHWYLTQTKARHIHHLGEDAPNPEAWRLGLPYQQRTNALVLENKAALSPNDIHHDNILDRFWARTEGFVLPSGHLCNRARLHFEGLQNLDANEQVLKAQIDAAHREPVYAVGLLADRYCGDDERQVRMSISCLDGFGRVLQTRHEVEPGMAWLVDDNGELMLNPDGTPQQADVPRRWRISEPVEYNNKGQKVRIYRPYFADQPRYVNDRSMRERACHDQQFYDAAGRPTETILARQMLQGTPPQLKPLRRETWYWVWCSVAFDENDLFEPPLQKRSPSCSH